MGDKLECVCHMEYNNKCGKRNRFPRLLWIGESDACHGLTVAIDHFHFDVDNSTEWNLGRSWIYQLENAQITPQTVIWLGTEQSKQFGTGSKACVTVVSSLLLFEN